MAMQAVYFKEHEGIAHDTIGQLSSVAASAPWWTALGSQTVRPESLGQMKPFSLDFPNYVDHLTGPKQPVDKGHTTPFTIFPGNFLVLPSHASPHWNCIVSLLLLIPICINT